MQSFWVCINGLNSEINSNSQKTGIIGIQIAGRNFTKYKIKIAKSKAFESSKFTSTFRHEDR